MLLDIRIRLRSLLRQWFAKKHDRRGAPGAPFFFIHIHKTAGTAFRYMLYEQFDQNDIFPNLKDIKKFGGRYPRYPELLEIERRCFSDIRLLIGHYPFVAGELLPRRPRYLVFLRDPLSRAISNLRHLEKHEYGIGTDMEFIFSRATNAVFNVQTRFFAAPYHQQPLSRDDLEVAKKNLACCDFIGMTEEFEDSIRLAERMFGWKLGKTLSINVGRQDHGELDPGLLERLKTGNEFDFEFYEYGKTLFRKLQQRCAMK